MRTSLRWLSIFTMVALLAVSSAAPAVGRSPNDEGGGQTSPATPLVNTPAQQQAMMNRLESMREGDTIVLGVVDGYRVIATRSAGQLNVLAIPLGSKDGLLGSGPDVTPLSGPSFCSYAVASFLWGLGAGFLALAAFLGITITGPFGIVIGPYTLGLLAGFMGSYSLLLSAVSFYLC